MTSKYATFDRSRLKLRPLAERVNDLEVERWLALDTFPALRRAILAFSLSRYMRL